MIIWDEEIDYSEDFNPCIYKCDIPLNNNGASYLLVRYIILMFPTETMWYIFYLLPQKFNAKMRLSTTFQIDLAMIEENVLH
jgi:hypothetical protein